MSFNGSGTFLVNSAGQPVVTNTTITSTAFNLFTADIATGLSTCLTKDGQTTPTANIPMGTFKITGLGNGTASTDAAAFGQLTAFGVPGYTTTATAAGSTTLTVASTYNQYFTGVTTQTVVLPVTSTLVLGFQFDITNMSTGVVTVNSSGGNAVVAMVPLSRVTVTCILTSGTSAASWDIQYTGKTAVSGTGSLALTTSPSFTTPTLGVASATSLATSAATPLLMTNGQLVNVALTSQTVGATTLTIPNFASVVDEFTFKTKSQTMANKTLTGAKATTTFGVGAATPSASGSGITFPATQDPSTDANTLDDYEEGTWTPVLTFATPGDLSVAYTTQVGFYTKIGRFFVISGQIVTSTFTHTTASGNVNITGVPFTSLATSFAQSYGATTWGGITKASFTYGSLFLGSNATTLAFAMSGSGQSATNVSASDMPTAGTVTFRFSIPAMSNA